MDYIPVVLTIPPIASNGPLPFTLPRAACLSRVSFDRIWINETFCRNDTDSKSNLFDKEVDYSKIQIPEGGNAGVKDGKDIVFIVFKVGRCTVGRFNGPAGLLDPRILVIYLDIRNWRMEDVAVMNHRHGNGLGAVGRCYNAAVAVALLAVILVGLKVHVTNRRRIGSDCASPILSCCREPRERRKKGRREKHGGLLYRTPLANHALARLDNTAL